MVLHKVLNIVYGMLLYTVSFFVCTIHRCHSWCSQSIQRCRSDIRRFFNRCRSINWSTVCRINIAIITEVC